jgi:ribonuclease HII
MSYLCGIDEAGRGPLAGPVTAAAVLLGPETPRELLIDSKRLSPKKREIAAAEIRRTALCWGIGWADHREIDALNIHHAALLAMRRAYYSITVTLRSRGLQRIPITQVLVDGKFGPDLSPAVSVRAIVGGDGTVPEIAAASIMAKTSRDRWMVEKDSAFPGYGLALHKGYPTAEHRESIVRQGPSPIHRRSFRLVRSQSAS